MAPRLHGQTRVHEVDHYQCHWSPQGQVRCAREVSGRVYDTTVIDWTTHQCGVARRVVR